ncbi:hypothetical protein BX616_004263, partial [Lobosporangium transversale]
MVNRRSIDFVVRMLNASVFHLSFPFFLIPCIKLYGITNEGLAFQLAAVYGVLLFTIRLAYWLHDRSQRQDGKIDWDDEIVLITGVDIESYICDVSNPEDIVRVAKEIREDVGEPTILVNNAGIVHGKPILDLSVDDIK